MRVSVVVPLYNKAETVLRALRSIAGQSFSDFEAIVVDDGSTDGGLELVARFPDPRFRVVSQANAGPGAARNRGLAEARGDLAAFLDADDAWMPGYLENSVRLLDASGQAVASVTSGYVEFPGGASSQALWRRRGLAEGVHRVTASTPVGTLVSMLAYMSPCSTVARLEVVRRWGGFYEKDSCRYGEDAFLWLKVLLNESVCFEMRPVAEFHREASSLSANYRRARPIEPFLLDPDAAAAACPPALLPLLRRFYAARASKTAAVLGCFGDWRSARRLFGRFVKLGDWRLPYFLPGLAGCTPLAQFVGRPLVRRKASGQ